MTPLVALINAWNQVTWVFTTYLPSWWRAVEADVSYLRNIGE